jgi:hypothetical protein
VREPIEATQALEAYIGEGPQGHQGIGKKRDRDFTSRPPLPKKGKVECLRHPRRRKQ